MNNVNFRIINYIICFFIGVFTVCFIGQCKSKTTGGDIRETISTDTITKRDTITKTKIIPNYIVKKETITDTFNIKGDTVQVAVEIPIEQKVYQDSDYYAVVSGFKASLDTLKVFPVQTIITREITQEKTKYKPFGVSIQGGYGYSFRNKNLTPYVGVGLHFNIFR